MNNIQDNFLMFELTKNMEMNSFYKFYFSSKITFWTLNFVFDILLVSFICLIFRTDITEFLIQVGIFIPMTILSIWTLGGYEKVKIRVLKRRSEKLNP